MASPMYVLDTNVVSLLIKGNEKIRQKVNSIPMNQLHVSSITEAELRRGVAKKPEAKKLARLVNELLIRVELLPWDSDAAMAYAVLRTESEKLGTSLSTMDMLIASHACATEATLVTSGKAFFKLKDFINIQDWL